MRSISDEAWAHETRYLPLIHVLFFDMMFHRANIEKRTTIKINLICSKLTIL